MAGKQFLGGHHVQRAAGHEFAAAGDGAVRTADLAVVRGLHGAAVDDVRALQCQRAALGRCQHGAGIGHVAGGAGIERAALQRAAVGEAGAAGRCLADRHCHAIVVERQRGRHVQRGACHDLALVLQVTLSGGQVSHRSSLDQARSRIRERRAAQHQRATSLARLQRAAVGQCARQRDAQVLACLNRAAVVQCRALQCQVALREQHPIRALVHNILAGRHGQGRALDLAAVGHAIDRIDAGCTSADQQAAVVEAERIDGQRAILAAFQRRGREQLTAVADGAGRRHGQRAGRLCAARVRQRGGIDRHMLAGGSRQQQPIGGIGQRAGGGNRHAIRALDGAAIVERGGVDGHGASQQFATGHVGQRQRAIGTQEETSLRLQQARVLRRHAGRAMQRQIGTCQQLAGIVEARGRMQREARRCACFAAGIEPQLAGARQRGCVGTGQAGAHECRIAARLDGKLAVGLGCRATAVQGGAGGGQIAARRHGQVAARAPAGATDRGGVGERQVHVVAGRAGSVAGGGVGQAVRRHGQRGAGLDQSFVQGQATIRAQHNVLLRGQRRVGAGQFQLPCTLGAGLRNGDIAAGRHAALHQHLAVRIELEVTRIRGGVAQHAHAHTRFGGDQADAAGVHAAQCARIDRELRCRIARLRAAGDGAVAVRPLYGTGDNTQVAASGQVDLAVQAHGTRDDVENLLRAGVQAGATYQNIAAGDVEAADLAVCTEEWHAGRQRDSVTVDEAATVAGDAVLVGHDDIRFATQHLGEAGQRAAPRRHHLVQDHFRLRRQIDVAHHLTGQLRRHDRSVLETAVVEHQALALDVVTVVLVMRQAGGVRIRDVDHRDAVGGHIGRRVGIGGQHRCGRCSLRQCMIGGEHHSGECDSAHGAPRLAVATGSFGGNDVGATGGAPDLTVRAVHVVAVRVGFVRCKVGSDADVQADPRARAFAPEDAGLVHGTRVRNVDAHAFPASRGADHPTR